MQNSTNHVGKILSELFKDESLKIQYINEIRRFSIIGKLANEKLEKEGFKQRCKILAIGDIKYFGDLETKWEVLISDALKSISSNKLLGYDLTGLGSFELRESLFNYSNLYYNFNTDLDKNNIIDSIIPTYGATDGFSIVIDVLSNLYSDKNIKFIYPEASFLANVKIAEDVLGKSNLIKLNKPGKNDFFINESQINSLEKTDNNINIYYITPVGNPTGEKLDSNKLFSILSYISEFDENGMILLDNVYVGLLEDKDSQEMFSGIFSNGNLLNKIIFIESLSKTLGTTGIRLGWLWTLNKGLSQEIKTKVILKKAGFSKVLGELCINMFSDLEKIVNFQNDVYNFFSKQRLGFLEDVKNKYSKFFDFDFMPKILDREGIYLLLKLREGYKIENVFSETGIIGVKIELSDGVYVRYAFGNVDYF